MRRALILTIVALLLTTTTAIAKPTHHREPPSTRPPSSSLIEWTLKWKHLAWKEFSNLNDLRTTAGLSPVRYTFSSTPPKTASVEVWLAAGREWKHKAHEFRAAYRRTWRRLTHPAGSGVERWRPLVTYYWPDHLVNKALWVMDRESGGCPGIRNRRSGAAGLFQLLPAPAGWSNPATNIRYAYQHKYLPAGGWSPWAACGA